jgi:hypothetical protein
VVRLRRPRRQLDEQEVANVWVNQLVLGVPVLAWLTGAWAVAVGVTAFVPRLRPLTPVLLLVTVLAVVVFVAGWSHEIS